MVKKPKVLITGASRGLGLAIAQALNKDYCLILHATKAENITQLKENNYILAADFSNPEEVTTFCKTLKAQHGDDLYAVINNAGITRDGLLMRMSEEQWDEVIRVNLKSIFNLTKAVTKPMMKAKSGSIINMTSIVGIKGNAGQSNYAASKAGIIGFTKSIALELGSRNIRCNAIAPGFIETEMTEELNEAAIEEWTKSIPMKRGGQATEVADVCLFLGSDMSSYVTGQVISVNGGLLT